MYVLPTALLKMHWSFEECSASFISLPVSVLSNGCERYCIKAKFWSAHYSRSMSHIDIAPHSGDALLPSVEYYLNIFIKG